MKKSIIAAGLTALLAVACPSIKAYRVADYYPLAKDAVWTYRVTTFEQDPKGESMVRTARVVGEKDGEFQLRQGDDSFSYLKTPEGIMKAKSRNFLIKEPVEKGATWKVDVSGGGMAITGSARVTAKGIETRAGSSTFADCAVVEETFEGVGRHVSTYCPGTGLVKLEVYEAAKGAEKLIYKAELLAYQAGGALER